MISLLLLALVETSSAEDLAPVARSHAWLAELGGFAGVDLDGRAAVVQGYGLAASRWMVGERSFTLAYGGDLRGGFASALWLEDLHQINAVWMPTRRGLGLDLEVQGSAMGDRWGEAALAGRLGGVQQGRFRADLQVGPVGRIDAERAAVGLIGLSDARLFMTPRAVLGGHLEGRQYLNAPGLTAASLAWTWGPRPRLSLKLHAGLSASWGTVGTSWADQVAAGEVEGWSRMSVEVHAARRVTTSADLATWTSTPVGSGVNLAARAGLSWRDSGQTDQITPAEHTLRISAPAATRVELLGSFSDWEPRPMVRDAEGTWSVTLTLTPGIWLYVFRVDGVVVSPPDAALIQEDEFGLVQGVIVVSAPAPEAD